MDKIDFILAGVGGQGIVLMSDLLAEAAMEAGFDVKKSDVFGMARQGGSVVSQVRLGTDVRSPLLKSGEVECLVALEKLEAARWASSLRPGGVALVNDYTLFPLSVSSGADEYPTDAQVVLSFESRGSRIHLLDGTGLSARLGNPKVLNVVILGYLASLLPLPWDAWLATSSAGCPRNTANSTSAPSMRDEEQPSQDWRLRAECWVPGVDCQLPMADG